MVEQVTNSAHEKIPGVGNNMPARPEFKTPGPSELFKFGNGINLANQSAYVGIYGAMALNDRRMGAYRQKVAQMGNDYENINRAGDDKENLESLSEVIKEYRVLGVRWRDNHEVTETLKAVAEEHSGVALAKVYGGLKNPQLQPSFDNLKNPKALVKHLQSNSLIVTPDANEDINILSDIAIKEKSPALAAILLEATKDSKFTFVGTDRKTAQKLLIDSRKMFDNDAEYHHYISGINKSYKELFPGENLDKYIADNNKPWYQRMLPAAGAASGALITAAAVSGPVGWAVLACGAAAGALTGSLLNKTNIFGLSDKGQELRKALIDSNAKSHDINPQKYQFGGISRGLITAKVKP